MSLNEITKILSALDAGTPISTEELFPHVYTELRVLAAKKMRNEQIGATLDATGLVHEAFMRLSSGSDGWKSRAHFFAAAAEAMRRILCDRARARQADKRGGGKRPAMLADDVVANEDDGRVLILSEVLSQFEAREPKKAELVKLRYFAGLTTREAAEVLQVSTATADRWWAYARAWLQTAIDEAANE